MQEKTPNIELGSQAAPKTFYIKITKNGPYMVYGNPSINEMIITPNEHGENWTYRNGKSFGTEDESCCALCRCGASTDKPFCAGVHESFNWESEETASFEPLLDNADVLEGPELVLFDNDTYCAFARFCDARGRVWDIVERAQTPEEIELVKREVAHCSGGRLRVWDRREQKMYEPDFEPSISIIEDPGIRVSGPIWVRGGIRIESADGESYEIRNRVTLCRCGASHNKPFCDGTHANFKWE
ncbi:MAG: CDGSH iron-sulfur domain-containing protein [Bacteroidetes bacterium]|nr:CDGSH iron-sulfur domain-containing protein [Bacteroidota bacterium]